MLDAIVISDLHINSEVCCEKELTIFFKRILDGNLPTKKIILNGDVFDSKNFKKGLSVLSLLRKVMSEIETIFLVGNHDGTIEEVHDLFGIKAFYEYEMLSQGKKLLFVHGDRFDEFMIKHPLLTKTADWIYGVIQKLEKSHQLAISLKKMSKTYLHCIEKVENSACDLGIKRNCDFVLCGHTHRSIKVEKPKITYLNSGCWTELPCSYITVKNGNCQIEFFH